MSARSRWSTAAHASGIALGLAVVVYGVIKLDLHKVGAELGHARLGLIALAAAINFLHIACKSERWRLMLRPVRLVSSARLFQYLIVGFAASVVLPARAGEAFRVVLLRRRHDVPLTPSIAILVAEKLFEVLGLLVLVAPLPFLLPLPNWVKASVGLVAAGGIGGTIAALVIAHRIGGEHGDEVSGSVWNRLAAGLRFVRKPSTFFVAFAWSVAAYLVDAVEVWLVLIAVGIHVPLAATALVLLTLNLAISVPSTPGQIGTFEAGAVAGLSVLGVPLEPALAFALLYHVMQVAPTLVAGLSGLPLIRETRAAA